MFTWITKIWQLLGKDNISYYENLFFKRGFTILSIQFCGLALLFGSNILFVRLYGEHVYGVYSLLSSWVVLLAAISLFGMDDMHLVRVPTMKLRDEKKKIQKQINWSLSVNAVSILVVVSVFYFIINFFNIPALSDHAYYFNFAFLIVLFLTVINNLICVLRGLDKVVWGEVIDKIARPFFFIVFLVIFFYLWKKDMVIDAVLANSAGLAYITILLLFAIQGGMKKMKDENDATKNSYSLTQNVRYTFLNLLYILSTRIDILVLGLLADTTTVGHYNVAIKFADIMAYPIAIINLSLPTLFSRERHIKGERAEPLIMYHVSKNSFFQCLALGLFFLISGKWILSWYGKNFADVFPLLGIFLISNLISAFTGSADVFFIMHGREKTVIYCRAISLAFTIVFLIFLIPGWGIAGAAMAMLAGNLVYCGSLQYLFFKKSRLFIHPFKR